jgi:hypothetical protein
VSDWIIDADGDLRYDAPGGQHQHILASDFEFDADSPDHFGRLEPLDAVVAMDKLEQLVRDGLRWRQLYQAGTAAQQAGGCIDGLLAVGVAMGELLEQATPAEKIAWRSPSTNDRSAA